jgi:hypothetical protein
METILRNVAVGYSRLFPELLDRFYRYNDMTIVDLIAEKSANKIEKKIVNISELKENIVYLLKNTEIKA